MNETVPAMTRASLIALAREHAHLVGIDSDGCVFDSMELKQKRCFHPLIIEHWRLEAFADQVRETAGFVTLYSRYRGSNRYPALVQTFDFLREHPVLRARSVSLPRLDALRRFIGSGAPLSKASLTRAVAASGDNELAAVLEWSHAVDAAIEREAAQAPLFAGAREALAAMAEQADTVCVSQTPSDALLREWRGQDLARYVKAIAGQELGTKADHLRLAAGEHYAAANILMIGDAPGDLQAARTVGAHFYPILPGRETAAWERLLGEAFALFLAGSYGGAYAAARTKEFLELLPSQPPWLGG